MDLTSVANVRAYAGLTTSDISDTDLGNLVSRASSVIREYCSRDITDEGPYTEEFNGTGGVRFIPQHWPVTAVSSVSIDGVTIPAATSATANGHTFSQGVIALRGYRYNRGVVNCSVTYSAGEATVPAAVEHAAILTVLAAYYAACRDPAVRSESVPGINYQATYVPLAIPEDARLILNQTQYVRRWS